nr:endo-1,3-alpha-glucanase family glycosylhydrolase [Mycobacterium numidiamassiliense]
MTSFPISIDNKGADQDYYATQYLTVHGEKGIHAAYGGYLRDRPLPRPVSDRADWQLADVETEIGQAKSVGIDGFAVDVIALRASSNVVDRMLKAASVAGDFDILVTADVTGPLGAMDPEAFAAEIAPYLVAPGAFHLADGRPVLGAFAAERKPTSWWTSVLNILRTQFNAPAAFVPTFLDVADSPENFAPFSYGFSMWGGRSPSEMADHDTGRGSPVDVIRRTHQLGKLWMQPVAFQDARPRSGVFEESDNSLTNRLSWQLADQQRAEWVQLITWNDYSESTAMAPSVAHGWRILDMNAYDITGFKTGAVPAVDRDALFVSFRDQPVSATPRYPETSLTRVVPSSAPPRDTVEVVAFATAPAQVSVRAGSQVHSCDVAEGRTICTFPLTLGSFSATMTRAGAEVATAQSNADITETPYTQDLQYRVVGGLR